jgi:pantoate--beta-alanine ligase
MVRDLNLNIEIVSGKTYREQNGLAMSSRNQYLTIEQRDQASLIFQVMNQVSDRVKAGEKNFFQLCQQAFSQLKEAGFIPDYVDIRRESDLALADNRDKDLRIFVAAQLGKARLIDNLAITLPE